MCSSESWPRKVKSTSMHSKNMTTVCLNTKTKPVITPNRKQPYYIDIH